MLDVSTQEIVKAYLNNESRDDIYTNIIPAHLSQMCLFGIRQGVEFYPQYDPLKQRKETIDRLVLESKLPLYMRSIWEYLLASGSVLFYLRPTEDFFELLWFYKDQFEVFYDTQGRLEKVVIVYSYNEFAGSSKLQTVRWVRLVITADTIRQGTYDHDPAIAIESSPVLSSNVPSPGEKIVKNSLGLIPCIVIDNDPQAPGKRGQSDFDWLSPQIEYHNRLSASIINNIEFFGNPTLITTRPASQVVEAASIGSGEQYRGVSTGSGFQNPNVGLYSTRKFDYSRHRNTQDRIRVKKVIGSVEPDERIGYIVPDQVSGDQNNYVNRLEEQIRSALGGVSELGFSAGATAFEIKSLYGKAAATSKRKAEAIYTHGLCEVFKLAIAAQEFFFRQSFQQAIGRDTEKLGEISDQEIQDYLFGNLDQNIKPKPIPPGVIGIIPQGDRKVNWRWTGPVFEDTPADKQQLSILMRNLTEEGISTLEAFKTIFPDRSDAEINALLGGVPFRRGQRIISLVQMLLAVLGQMGSIPLASNPGVPSAMVFGPGIEQAIAKLLEKLNEELNRGQQQYEPDLLSSPFTNLGGTEPAAGIGDGGDVSSEPGAGESFGPGLFGPGQFGNGTGTGTGPNQPLPAGPDTGISRERSTVSGSASGSANPYGPASVSPAAAAGLFPGYAPSSVPESAAGSASAANGNGVSGTAQPWDAAVAAIAGGGVGMEAGLRGPNQFAGYAGLGQQPEFTSPVPRPGSTISSWPSQPQWNQQSSGLPAGNAIGNADLIRQPGLLAKLFPTLAPAPAARKRGRSTK
jgi:hypothetical protein